MQRLIDELHGRFAPLDEGEPALYIPQLACVDPDLFGISVVTADGRRFDAGDAGHGFTLQSVSKPLVYGLALEACGDERLGRRVGVEPTGEPFNGIVRLDATGRPFNAMVNTGAIAVTDLIRAGVGGEGGAGGGLAERKALVEERIGRFLGRRPAVDDAVLRSERETGDRNRAIAYLLRDFGRLDGPVDESLELYFHQCSLTVTAADLAVAGATLAAGGVNPVTGEAALPPEHVPAVLSLMLSCGMYDRSGAWAYEVGLPAKSGVGGGITAVAPGRMGIGVFSPRIDAQGNSLRGMRVIEEISRRLGLHLLAVGPPAAAPAADDPDAPAAAGARRLHGEPAPPPPAAVHPR